MWALLFFALMIVCQPFPGDIQGIVAFGYLATSILLVMLDKRYGKQEVPDAVPRYQPIRSRRRPRLIYSPKNPTPPLTPPPITISIRNEHEVGPHELQEARTQMLRALYDSQRSWDTIPQLEGQHSFRSLGASSTHLNASVIRSTCDPLEQTSTPLEVIVVRYSRRNLNSHSPLLTLIFYLNLDAKWYCEGDASLFDGISPNPFTAAHYNNFPPHATLRNLIAGHDPNFCLA